jgi:glycosyltransferase involved in cell wall biosynthesis
MPSTALVSVIIPSFNYAAFLPEAVASVLSQRGPGLEVEVIVVDDGSTDNTAQVAHSLGPEVTYIHQENSGPSAARNTGLRAAHGDFAAFLDADDIFTARLPSSQLQVFADQPELDMVICRCLDVRYCDGGQESALWSLVNSHWDVHACHANLAPLHCFLVRMDCARRAGFFDEGLRSCEDQEYWLRCYAQGAKVGVNPEGLVLYTKHGENSTRNMQRMLSHDALMHVRIGDMLANTPDFPCHKYSGWLSHAAACLQSASCLDFNVDMMLKMQDFFVRAVHSAAHLGAGGSCGTDDAQLQRIQLYYAGRSLRAARNLRPVLTPAAGKAVMALERLFPKLAALSPEALDQRVRSTYARLCVPGLPPQVRVR